MFITVQYFTKSKKKEQSIQNNRGMSIYLDTKEIIIYLEDGILCRVIYKRNTVNN